MKMNGKWLLLTNGNNGDNMMSASDLAALSDVKAYAFKSTDFRDPLINHILADIDWKPTSLLLVGERGFNKSFLGDMNLYHYFRNKATTVVETTHEELAYKGKRPNVIVGEKPKPTHEKIVLVNLDLYEFIDVSCVKEDFDGMHPLPLLIANPDDDVGGSCVRCVDANEIGRWAGHVISSAAEYPADGGWKRITCFQVNNKEGVSKKRSRDDIYTLPLSKRRRRSDRVKVKEVIEKSKNDF
jgi:hypothetical protein